MFPYDWHFFKPVFTGAAVFGLGFLSRRWFSSDSIPVLAGQVVVLFLLYGALYLVMGIKSEDRIFLKMIVDRIKKI
jgi:hypothetical protein